MAQIDVAAVRNLHLLAICILYSDCMFFLFFFFILQPPMPYTFEWGVKDDVTLNDYAQQAASDGNVATGTYRVLLPDGRVQTVAYKADAVNGYIADVTYN